MRVTVLGNGQLGAALGVLGGERVTVLSRDMLDVCHDDQIRDALAARMPDIVINATAYNQVDAAEKDAARAFALNATAPGAMAQAARAVGARFVHVSTNYVFSGRQHVPYREGDLPMPLGIYGASKLAGEHLALAYAPDALVVRTSSVYGTPRPHGSNFVLTILRQARVGRPLRVVSDATMAPTYAGDLAQAILDLLETDASGLIHVANAGSCTWFEYAREIVALAKLDVEVEPVPTVPDSARARRPAYSVLDLQRLTALGISTPEWRQSLAWYVQASLDSR